MKWIEKEMSVLQRFLRVKSVLCPVLGVGEMVSRTEIRPGLMVHSKLDK